MKCAFEYARVRFYDRSSFAVCKLKITQGLSQCFTAHLSTTWRARAYVSGNMLSCPGWAVQVLVIIWELCRWKSNVRPTACMLHKTGSASFYCQTKFTEVGRFCLLKINVVTLCIWKWRSYSHLDQHSETPATWLLNMSMNTCGVDLLTGDSSALWVDM